MTSGARAVAATFGPMALATQELAEDKPSDVTSETGSQPLSRSSTVLSRAGSKLQRAASNITIQRAASLPSSDDDLRHAATMPGLFDVSSDRVCCAGLWKTQQLLGFLLGTGLAIALIAWRPMQDFPSANDMLGVTALVACFWVFEVLPVYVTALFPLVLMPLAGVTSSDIAAQAYWDWISLLVVGTYLLDIALEEVQLPRRLVLKALLHLGVVHPAALLACFMLVSWFCALFCNTIAVALLITPFATTLMNAAQEQALDRAAADGEDREAAAAAAKSVQRYADGVLLGVAFAATSGGIATLTGAIGNYFLAGEPVVTSFITWGHWFLFALPISATCLVLAYLVLYLLYVRDLKFSGMEREVLEEERQHLLAEVGPLSRDEVAVGVLSLLQVALFMARRSLLSPHFQTQYKEQLLNDATLACGPAILLFLIPSQRRRGQALLTWPAVHKKFDFGLLLLIGGSLAVAKGFEESGLNIALGDAVSRSLPHAGSFWTTFWIVAVISLSSQVFSSIGTAAAMLPVLEAAALHACVNPLALMLPATVATSFAFVLPTATPTNVVVLAKSTELMRPLRLRDFVRAGGLLTVLVLVAGTVLIWAMAHVVFDAHAPFPEWACEATGASCLWVPVPGDVQGRGVAAQACIVRMGAASGVRCRLWNGTLLETAPYLPPSM